MSTGLPTETDQTDYPDSDGQPMSDNTLQWDWMVKIVSELRLMYAGQNVFVAGDLLWYPVQGDPKTRLAPDGMVVFGRPPGYRGSYMQWREDDVAPHVVFEVLSPRNTLEEMIDKQNWYERFGVEEFYIIDPYEQCVEGYVRRGGKLMPIDSPRDFRSPRLGIRFVTTHEGLMVFTPEGREFQTREEQVADLEFEIRRNAEVAENERRRAEQQQQRAEQEQARAVAEFARAEAERDRAERERIAKEALIAKLRELGVDPDSLRGVS